jgi:putative radical SAM enzyme (TIGR03279 family)
MKIVKIKENSLAQEIGLTSGDRLLKINGERVLDHLDYEFRIADENVTLDFQIKGELNQIIVEKNYDDDLGVEFEEMKVRKCGNDCVFCFVDQNPENMRDGIYFRDGDYRMSYLYGHYITMTNMSKKELKRIVDQKLSPLYISVHATDVELRKELLLYKWGKEDFLLEKIKYLINNGIELHGQIVLIPNKNDGEQLYKTASDIYKFYPHFKTLSIVPVGLTRHREGLPELEYVNQNYAENLFKIYPDLNKKFPGGKSPFVILSDEWYILGGKPFPPKSFYGEYDLVENGVGQFRDFLDRFNLEKKNFPKTLQFKKTISIVTSTLVFDIFVSKIKPELDKIKNLKVNFFKIKNNFFGDSVTVAGLLTGKDIISQLKGQDLGSSVWATYRILNDDQTLTLDDMTLNDISKSLKTKFRISKNDSINDIIESISNET